MHGADQCSRFGLVHYSRSWSASLSALGRSYWHLRHVLRRLDGICRQTTSLFRIVGFIWS